MIPFLLLLILAVQLFLVWTYINRNGDSTSSLSQYLDQWSARMREEQDKLHKTLREEWWLHRQEAHGLNKEQRNEMQQAFSLLTQSILTTLEKTAHHQKNLLDSVSRQMGELTHLNEQKLEAIRNSVETKLERIQADNERKLEQMRQTVDEKLSNTLEERLGKTFQLVSERLERVHQSLGEMQSLASGVDDLRKVLSNVKNRGILGEIQLENILEQILTPEQYEKNAAIKKNTKERVEFAIKLPSKQENEPHILLPIDSKFPLEDYQRLLAAQENGQPDKIEESLKSLETRIKQEAKTIADKYIHPPNTTDFAILFLPLEGLYAEVLRRPGLFETLTRKHKVVVAGPTTLTAFLNSLQMGFRTLAIQKHTNEAWRWLGLVKQDLSTFASLLEKAQKKIEEASSTIGKATRHTETMKKKLRQVEHLPLLDRESAATTENLPPSSSEN